MSEQLRDAAVDRQLGAGRVGGVEGQEGDSSRDLLVASESSHRVVRHHLRAGALDDVGGKGPFEDAGVDGAGADRVDADPRGSNSRAKVRAIERSAALLAA